jgi:Tol biopolymer transport system component/predicted Ser/Thr protein kinase
VIGQTLGHYRIESKLGEGGMGVVYRAVDTHLDRLVAIKVLPPEAVADTERKRRFAQEARAASALNHPSIITIYDIDRSEDVDFIAMEYVQGQPLDRLIERGSIALSEALRYAIQVADALGKAHGAGIIHRDLKPANIMVTPEGAVKLLDFGLAKLIEAGSNHAATATFESSPLTERGTVIGTIAYMSPEQAQGKPIDARSDIFSFGAVLYEMVTGRRAFSGDTKLATLTAILHHEPKPISELTRTAPPELDRIVHRCLRKDPNRRFHHVIDVKVALEELKEEADPGKSESLVAPLPAGRWLIPLVGIGLLAVIAAFWLGTRERDAPLPHVLTRLTSDSGLTTEPALSADGKLVAYASDRSGEGNLDIWVQQVSSGEAIRLTRDPADDRDPDFSSDGQKIVFRSDRDGGGIFAISALGGTDRLLARRGQGPRFSPDGSQIVYWVGSRGGYTASEIHLADTNGGTSRVLDVGVAFAQSPVWSPDGRHLLFVGARHAALADLGDWDWWVYHFDGGQSVRTDIKRLLQEMGITSFREPDSWLPGERVVFSATFGDSTNLWELSLSASTWHVEGTPRRLTTGPGPELHPSAAGNGRMVFANHIENLGVWWLPMEVNQGKVLGELQRATGEAASESQATISSDGSRLSFVSDRAGNDDIWTMDLATGKETAVTLTPFDEVKPVSNRDGTNIAYNRPEHQRWPIYVASTRQPDVPEKVCEDCRGLNDSSSDGSRFLYSPRAVDARTPIPIALLNLISREKIRLIEHPTHTLFSPRFSPDDAWVSFHEFTGLASRRIYVAPLRGNAPVPRGDWVPITDGAGLDRDACWAPDGNLLYFWSERDGFPCIWAQRLEPRTKRPFGEMFPVYHLHHARRSIRTFDNLALARLSTAQGKLVFSMGEYTGNIWMGTTQQR